METYITGEQLRDFRKRLAELRINYENPLEAPDDWRDIYNSFTQDDRAKYQRVHKPIITKTLSLVDKKLESRFQITRDDIGKIFRESLREAVADYARSIKKEELVATAKLLLGEALNDICGPDVCPTYIITGKMAERLGELYPTIDEMFAEIAKSQDTSKKSGRG